MAVRLILSYRGGAYAGWQRQRNALTVQQVVEEALERLLGAPARVVPEPVASRVATPPLLRFHCET